MIVCIELHKGKEALSDLLQALYHTAPAGPVHHIRWMPT